MRIRRLFLFSLISTIVVLGISRCSTAATVNVPADYATIGAAVAAASDGDTILLAPGTYNAGGDLNLNIDKSLTFEASGTAANTIIDCNGNKSFVEQLSSNDLSLTFQNLTFKNTVETVFDFNNSSGDMITFNSCVFTQINGSAAVTSVNANSIVVTGCIMHGNSAMLFELQRGTLTVSDSDFERNYGIVLGANGTVGTVSDCRFWANGASNENGPIYWSNAPLTMSDCNVSGNDAGNSGAIVIDSAGVDTPVKLDRCILWGNGNASSQYGGGAILMYEGDHNIPLVMTDCIFFENNSNVGGAVLSAVTGGGTGSITITNCSFWDNVYGESVIAANSSTSLTITNSIMYADKINEISTDTPPSSQTVSFTDIDQPGYAGLNGNIDADPMYVLNYVDLPISNASPCVQAGTSTGAPPTDLHGYAWGSRVSMGAFSPLHFAFTTPPFATAGVSFPFNVTAMAADNSTTIINYSGTVHFTSSNGSAPLPINSTLTNGTGSFRATLNTIHGQTITAADTSTAAYTSTSAGIAVSGPATHFVVSSPSTATSNVPVTITVTAEDDYNDIAAGYTGTVHIRSTDPGFLENGGAITLNAGTGQKGVTFEKAGSQTVTATDTVNRSITGTSNNVTVYPGGTVTLAITGPATGTFKTPSTFNVTALDAYGNTATGYAGTVRVTSNAPSQTPPVNATLTSGRGRFLLSITSLGTFTVTAKDTVIPSITGSTSIAISASTLRAFSTGWQMISAPSDYTGYTMSQIFSPTAPTVDAWNASTSSYAVTSTAPADTIRPGIGYWADITHSTTLLDIGVHTNPSTPVTVALSAGWNMIGDPFNAPVNLTPSVTVSTNTVDTETFDEATHNGLLSPYLFTFAAGASTYTVETSTLQPFAGYWIYAYVPCTLTMSGS